MLKGKEFGAAIGAAIEGGFFAQIIRLRLLTSD